MSKILSSKFGISDNEMDIVSQILFGKPIVSETPIAESIKETVVDEAVRNMSLADENARSGPDSGSGIPTMTITASPSNTRAVPTRRTPTKTIRNGNITPIKRDTSSDDLNQTSLNVARGIDKDTDHAVGNIRKRIKDLNTNNEEAKKPFTSTEPALEKKASDFELIPGEDAKKVKEKKPVVKFEEFLDLNKDENLSEAEASATHTGKIKSSRRILKPLQLAVERDKEVPFQYRNQF